MTEGKTVFSLDHKEEGFGDYATNIAFSLSKKEGIPPKDYAEKIVPQLQEVLSEVVEKIEVAGPGFINFFLKDDIRTDEAEAFSRSDVFNVEKKSSVIVEYTDPNPFKLFHIGHLVPNAIGESIARLYESQGNTVTRICYQGDVGMHVAKTIWGIINQVKAQDPIPENGSLKDKVAYMGKAYAFGNLSYEENAQVKNEIIEINKAVYKNENMDIFPDIQEYYNYGKKISLEYFETIYQKLGTKFDHLIMESEVGKEGKEIVKKNLGTVFEESDGALVYKGEKVGLHTRVFVNKEGLPTYEAKELGNTYKKKTLVPNATQSIVVTANEIDEYFKVIKAALREIDAPLSDSIHHISHGMLRLPEGKMSSRTGNIISAEDLISQVESRIEDRVKEMRVEESNRAQLVTNIAVGAIKFAILKSAPGKDMVFDFEKSLSFEGDSGPYLQYTHARLSALLDKANEAGIDSEHGYVVDSPERALEGMILEYPHILFKAYKEIGPHHVVQYLLALTRVFNGMYSRVQIVDENNKNRSMYYLMLSKATKNILANGLHVLGIFAPTRM